MNLIGVKCFFSVMFFYCLTLQTEAVKDVFDANEEEILGTELEWLNAESYNTTAFKFKDQVNKSPGSITVVTAQEIAEMGARDLLDILQTVPGISVYRGAYNCRIQVRGILTPSSQDVLMMINGLPVTNNYIGSGLWVYNQMGVDIIQRVEVIKGPASSLYGANAFSAIINVITKSAADNDGIQVIQKIGTDNAKETSILFGKIFKNGLELNGYADFVETDGFSGEVTEDRQSALDSAVGSSASLAPGYTNNRERRIQLGLSAKYEGFFLDSLWTDRERGPNIGIYDAISDTSLLKQKDGYINVGYEWEPTRNLMITPNIYYHYNLMHNRLQMLPAGTKIPTNIFDKTSPLVDLPLGVESLYDVTNVRLGTEVRADWKVIENYRVTFGANYEQMRQKDIGHKGTHYYHPNGDIEVLSNEEDVPDEFVHIDRAERTFKAFYIENLIDVTDDLRLTIGGRYDHYSDFGGTFNPRASLIWTFIEGYDLKLLYGRAFRAPSFYELYSKLPYVMGNPNLDPEIIDSYEVALNAKVTNDLNFTFTFFHNEIKDSILETFQGSAIQFGNTEKISIQGFEVEGRYNLDRGSYLLCNYTYQHSYDHESGARVGKVPLQFIFGAANFRLTRQLDWFTSVFWSAAPNPRHEDGGREFGESYAVVNTGITAKEFIPGLENLGVRFFIYNVFDKEYYTDYSTELPGGAPMPDRQYMFEINYRF